MKILFLGGNRYFGRKILKLLSNDKNNYIYLINRGNKKNLKKKNIFHLEVDRTNYNSLQNKIKDIYFDIIFDNIAYRKKDVAKLLSVLKNRYKKYIFSSSVIVNALLDKKYKKVLEKYSNEEINYGQKKYQIEKYLLNKKINCNILRIHSVLGKNDFSNKSYDLLNAKYQDLQKFNISGKNKIQFIYDEDLSRIIFYLIKNYNKIKTKILEIANEPIIIEEFYNCFNSKKIKKKSINRSGFPFPINLIVNNDKLKKIIPNNLLTRTKLIAKKVQ